MEKQHHYSDKTLGTYHLMDEFAHSASGKLFLAKSSSSPEHSVVVKLLLSTPIQTQQQREQFLQEAYSLQQLHHPYILPILDAGIEESTPYIVTEYMPHDSLYSRLHRPSSAPLARAEVLTIIAQVGQALLYAHRHNVIHGNLKPQNILFNSEGQAVLADFAFHSLKMTSRNSSSTHSYAAPEQLMGPASKESDQYAFGCVIYEMFTGKAPFSSKETGTLAGARPRTTLAQLKARLPQDLSLIILKAIAREPMQRYGDLQDFLNALGILTMIGTHANNQGDVLREQSRTEWSIFHKNGQPRAIKEWPLIAIAVVIIILSIVGTLTFGALSTNSFQTDTNMPGSPTTTTQTPTSGTLITPTVVVTSTAVQPPMGQRMKANPTPTPTLTPTFSLTPTPVPPITSGFLSASPGGFSPANCASVNGLFACTATLSLSNEAFRTANWYTSSKNAGATFSPASGFLFPGQSVQITINIPQNCPGNSTLNFITSRRTLAVPWSC